MVQSGAQFILPRHIYDEIVLHAQSEYPNVACGIIAGTNGHGRRAYCLPNAEASPTFFVIEPKAQMAAMEDMDANGWELMGIFSSHVATEAHPSRADVELAAYPSVAYIYISLVDRDRPVVRAFSIVDEEVTERSLRIIDSDLSDIEGAASEAHIANRRSIDETARFKIFISYRREDTSHPAGRLYDRLSARFGDEQIFMDVDSLDPGIEFADVIVDTIDRCAVLLVVIGPKWLSATDSHGRRRLDDPNDFVRIEIETALMRNIRVIPVLIDNTSMPRAEELPDSLMRFADRNAYDISHNRFGYDSTQLIEVIDAVLRRASN